jgi:serine/threonine protein kinase
MDLALQVGKYDVQKLLGKGATGTVYLAKDTFTGKEVALKTIEPEVFRDPEFGTVYRAQFLNEASLAGKLRHPHIVSILDAVVGEDSGHIAMELVTGGDLSKHCASGTLLPVPDVLQIGFKCCGALAYAAKEGIVHRDIKPANIMLAGGTEVKIADFGAASLKKSQVVQTAALGSPYYMSPEQIEGKTALTFHSDMFSLGVVLYELLTGKKPFLGENLEDLIGKILKVDPPPPSAARPGLPKAIDPLVLRALKKDPAQRYASWPAFAMELSKAGELVLPPGSIPDSEKYVTLKAVPMLSTLADAELWELARAGRWRRVPKGATIVHEDESGRSFFFLARGEAKVTKKKKLLNMVNGGECFGEMAYIGGDQRRHATVEAVTDLLLAEFEPAALEGMSLGAQLQLTRALVRNVTDRLELANVRLAR